MDYATFTTSSVLHSGVSVTSRFDCRALLDTGSPQSFIHQGAFDQMVAMGAADTSCIRFTTSRTWSGFGSQQSLSTNRQARMTVQFNHNGTTSASLAVWMYIVPNETMRCPLLVGRDSWIRFHSRSYQTLPPQPDGRIFGELIFSPCDDNFSSAAAYIRNCETLDTAYHLIYNGPSVTRTDSPQLIPVNLVRLDGSPALTGHYMVNLLPVLLGPFETLCFLGSTIDTLDGIPRSRTGRRFRHRLVAAPPRPFEDPDPLCSPGQRLSARRVTSYSSLAAGPPTKYIRSSGRAPPRTSTPPRSQPTCILSSPLGHYSSPYSSDRFRAGCGWLGFRCP